METGEDSNFSTFGRFKKCIFLHFASKWKIDRCIAEKFINFSVAECEFCYGKDFFIFAVSQGQSVGNLAESKLPFSSIRGYISGAISERRLSRLNSQSRPQKLCLFIPRNRWSESWNFYICIDNECGGTKEQKRLARLVVLIISNYTGAARRASALLMVCDVRNIHPFVSHSFLLFTDRVASCPMHFPATKHTHTCEFAQAFVIFLPCTGLWYRRGQACWPAIPRSCLSYIKFSDTPNFIKGRAFCCIRANLQFHGVPRAIEK